MEKFSAIYKNFLLLFVIAILWFPIAQNKFKFFDVEPLNGDVQYPKEDSLNLSTWFEGEYQAQQEIYLNSAFGLRNFCVRVNNQLAYSFFNIAKANGVIIGKKSYLYEAPYLDAYAGKDFIGFDSIGKTVKKLKFISDTLAKMNKQLLIVFAAGKASYYPEFIPDKFLPGAEHTNYKLLARETKGAGLNVIDFNEWFMENKNKAKYPLFPQYGIHWSKYGSVQVADSIIKKIESLRKIDMPDLHYDSIRLEQPRDIDYDIGRGMNLLTRLKSFDMAYMNIKFENDSGKTKPRVLVVSDSFYWGIYDFGLPRCFQKDHFWYYYRLVYPETFKEETYSDYLSLGKEINNHDVVIIMATEANLQHLGWGFIEDAETLFKGRQLPHSDKYYEKLKSLVNYIKIDKKWFEETKIKAKEENITVTEQMIKEAKWVLQNEGLY